MPAVVVFVRPVNCTDAAVLLLTDVPVKLYFNEVPDRDAVPPVGTPLTVPTAGVPAVPPGTVQVTEKSVAVVAVVKPNV